MNVFDIDIKDIKGNKINWQSFQNKHLLFVNVASECGFTKQYKQLQELYEHHGANLEVIGMPCNDFGGQEPGSPEDIQQFCSKEFGVSFTLTEKLGIKSDRHPLIEYLCGDQYEIDWNFNKFMVDQQGKVVAHYKSAVDPLDEQILTYLN